MQGNRDVERIVVVFEKSATRFIANSKYNYGFVSEEEDGDKVRMTFLTCYISGLCRWILMYGKQAEIESPDKAKEIVRDLVDELITHYQPIATI